jgi:hypothetical protein
MWERGYTGDGQTIAVLDTGVDGTHPFLAGKVVEEACYSGNENCPNGQTTRTGAGAGVPCMYAPNGCGHGTHVAGIAAGGDSGMGFFGVARGANIMAVQVFSRETGSDCEGDGEDPCTKTFTSDQIASLERVYVVRNTHDIAAVNMSLGGGEFTEARDDDPRKAIIDNLFSEGIATVVASGNEGYTNAVAAPACISSTISVGATTDDDEVADFSNSGAPLDFLAPGFAIESSVPGGGWDFKNGTSMAAPHVAGAFAIYKQMRPQATMLDITERLRYEGTPVTDTRPGGTLTRMRINLADPFVFTVNSTDNVSRFGRWMHLPAEGREIWVDDGCNATECTLYEAIVAANAMPNFAEPDVIEFDIPGEGVRTIELDRRPYDNTTDTRGDLPPILYPVVIDGFTQPGASAKTNPLNGGSNAQPLIELRLKNGTEAGLSLVGDGSTIRGLVINRPLSTCCFGFGCAIVVHGSDHVVEGNYLGTTPAGEAAGTLAGFPIGVEILPGAHDNIIGGTAPAARNVISGNTNNIWLKGGTGAVIQGNYKGTNAAGTAGVLPSGPVSMCEPPKRPSVASPVAT